MEEIRKSRISSLINFVNLVDNHLSLSSNFERVYRKVCGRLRLLALVRRNLTMNAAELLYKMTILPILFILTCSSTVKTSFNKTQLLMFTSIERKASSIIGKPVDRISKTIEHNISTMVSKCVRNELNHEILDNYFETQNHRKGTRNNELVLKMAKIKLETSRSNNLPLDVRKSVMT